MTSEIRPVTRREVPEYLSVLPFANGLPSWEPAPAAWHAGEGPWPPAGPQITDEEAAAYADVVLSDGYRSQAAFVDGRIVGGSAMLSLELTVPGLRQVPFGGVTDTAVIATHRRRGLLRALMAAMFADCRDRGERLAGLSASEGSIYGRYGFAPATFQVRWELERTDARFLDQVDPPAGLELVSADVARAAWPSLHDRVRRQRVGEVSANATTWSGLSDAPSGTAGPLRFLVHRGLDGEVDGIAHFRLPWSADPKAAGTLQVQTLQAATPAAYGALWRLLTDFDLTHRVIAAHRPVDEPLRWMLSNPRALRITRSSDNLWLRLLDVGTALEARSYDATGSVVLAVDDAVCPWNQDRWRLETEPGGAHCRRAPGADPDLALGADALASLYLGGVQPAVLAGAGRIIELRPGALDALARQMRQDPAPYNAVGF